MMRTLRRVALLSCLVTLTACFPNLDWREVRNEEAGYAIMMPARPATMARVLDLNGTQVSMSMTAAEVDDITFAVGSAVMPDAAHAQSALQAMKLALVRNIGGTIVEERTLSMPHETGGKKGSLAVLHLQAKGAPSLTRGGQMRVLQARFVAVGNRVYQVIVMGAEGNVNRDLTDIYFSSLQLN